MCVSNPNNQKPRKLSLAEQWYAVEEFQNKVMHIRCIQDIGYENTLRSVFQSEKDYITSLKDYTPEQLVEELKVLEQQSSAALKEARLRGGAEEKPSVV